MTDPRIEQIKAQIRDVPDFPKPGILFKDITPLLAHPESFSLCIDLLDEALKGQRVDAIVGIEARGFIFGAALAARRQCGFVPVRKPGKLPSETARVEYQLEYGSDAVEMHRDALRPNAHVVLVDDVLATGGTAGATLELIKQQQTTLVSCLFLMELGFLKGRSKLGDVPIQSLITL